MIVLLTASLASFLVTAATIRFHRHHIRLSADDDFTAVQKFHRHSVSRIGGVAIAVALVAATTVMSTGAHQGATEFAILLLAGLPAFGGGVAEDLTKQLSPMSRLLLTMAAAALAFWLMDATLTRLDIPMIDELLRTGPLAPLIALVMTAGAVAGVANAINIIDGFNGLAGMVALMILAALGCVAYQLGDHLLTNICLASTGALLGFFVWNYPRGHIFLGDGGAYLIGFLIGEASVLLVKRHPEVSPWFPMLLVVYPVTETVFSMYRRLIIRKASPGLPDALHLHTLIFKRVVRPPRATESDALRRRNSATSPYLWLLCSFSIIPAVLFWQRTPMLIGFTLAFIVLYVWLYRQIIRFRTKWIPTVRPAKSSLPNSPRPDRGQVK